MNVLTTYAAMLLALGQAVSGEPPTRSSAELPAELPAELQAAAENLGSNKYETRQQATERLWSAGELAIPVLERATRSENREVRSRATYVLDNLRQGIAFDTPREILREVQRFRGGDADEKRAAIKNLEQAIRPRIVLGLMQAERDPRLRVEWSAGLERTIQLALLTGVDVDVERTLREAATEDTWIRHWVALLADRGRIDEELARLTEVKAPHNPVEHALRLAYLFRAKGELSEARRFAEQANSARGELASTKPTATDTGQDLAWELTLEQRDWPAAARRLQVRIELDPLLTGKDPETLGFATAYHRLAGDTAGRERYVRMLKEVADEAAKSLPELDPRRQDVEKTLIDRQWFAGKALLLNGEYDEAVRVLKRNHASFVIELLASQQNYRQAFEIAGVDYPHGFTTEWFEKVVAETAAADDVARQRFAIALLAVRQLYFLGQREEARQWLALIQRLTANDPRTTRRQMLCDTAVKMGLRELAVDVGASILPNPAMLPVLYPNRSSQASVWWEYFREYSGQESVVQTLTRIDRLLLYRGTRFDKPELQQLVADVETRLQKLVDSKRSEWWHGLGETCLLHGEREMALSFFEKASALSSADALRLGDLHATEEAWSHAAQWYRRACEFDKLKALPLYLYAQALNKSGRASEGQKLAAVALLLPLGDDEERRDLAAGLKERGFRAESLRQFELLVRTGEPGGQPSIEAAKQIGNAIYTQDALRGAECWEAMVLFCLGSKWGFVDAAGYVQIPFLVHKTRAKGLLAAGRPDEAIRELWAAERVAPTNLELAEELIPILQTAQRPKEAEELFQRCCTALRQLSQDFQNCATLHNNLAWLCACNGRDLEESLQHAERALKLDPDNPAYIDTLGEVQFRLGHIEQALTCAQRCLKIDPRSRHYQEQLVRYQMAGERPR